MKKETKWRLIHDTVQIKLLLDECIYIFYSWFDGSIELDRKWIAREKEMQKKMQYKGKKSWLNYYRYSPVVIVCLSVFSMLEHVSFPPPPDIQLSRRPQKRKRPLLSKNAHIFDRRRRRSINFVCTLLCSSLSFPW